MGELLAGSIFPAAFLCNTAARQRLHRHCSFSLRPMFSATYCTSRSLYQAHGKIIIERMRAPSIQQTWTQRDIDILRTLAMRVRMLNEDQIVKIWWPKRDRGEGNSQRRLTKMRLAGLIHRYRITCHPIIELDEPIFIWRPGDNAPNPGKIAHRLRSRWKLPSVTQTVFVGTEKTCRHLFPGLGGAGPGKIYDWKHDLHVAEVYRFYRRYREDEASLWVGEDALPKAGFGEKDPDAFLMDGKTPTRIVEFGGSYNAERVRDFHLHCRERLIEYELW